MGKDQNAWQARNPEVRKAHYANWLRNNPDGQLAYMLKKKYGLTLVQYKKMIKAQKGLCAICSRFMDPVCVDHDHETGKVRKLLCRKCNSGLGQFDDDPRLLAYALVYLEEHGKRIPQA